MQINLLELRSRFYEFLMDYKLIIIFLLAWVYLADLAGFPILAIISIIISFFIYFTLLLGNLLLAIIVDILNLILSPLVFLINVVTGSHLTNFIHSVSPFDLSINSREILPIGNPKIPEAFIILVPLVIILVVGFIGIITTED